MPRFVLSPLQKAELRARLRMDPVAPAPGQSVHFACPADDEAAWGPVAARLALALGAAVSLEARTAPEGRAAPDGAFATEMEVCRRLGIETTTTSTAPIDWPIEPIDDIHAPEWRNWLKALPGAFVRRVDDGAPTHSCAHARAIDQRAITQWGLPGLCLMEQAGIGATAVALELLRRRRGEAGGAKVLVLAGGGNNGGDAFVVARLLSWLGCRVRVGATAAPDTFAPDARANWDILASASGSDAPVLAAPFDPVHEDPDAPSGDADLLVDGLLGTGFAGVPRGRVREAMQLARRARENGATVLALDLPSGLDGDSGRAADDTVLADATVTFAVVKHGLFRADGPAARGELFLADLGIPVPPELAPCSEKDTAPC